MFPIWQLHVHVLAATAGTAGHKGALNICRSAGNAAHLNATVVTATAGVAAARSGGSAAHVLDKVKPGIKFSKQDRLILLTICWVFLCLPMGPSGSFFRSKKANRRAATKNGYKIFWRFHQSKTHITLNYRNRILQQTK